MSVPAQPRRRAKQAAETRRPSQVLLALACGVVIVAGLRAAGQILVPFMLALLVSFVSMPLLFWLRERRVPAALAVLLTMLFDVSLLAGAGLLLSGSVNDLARQAPKYRDQLAQIGERAIDWLDQREIPVSKWLQLEPELEGPPAALRGAELVDEPHEGGEASPAEGGETRAWWVNLFDLNSIVDLANRAVRGAAAALSNAVIVVLITTFILAEAATFRDKIRLAFGSLWWADRLNNVTYDLRRYLGIKTAISAFTGLLLGTWVAVLGIDFAFLWGLTAFALNFIPNLGSIIAAIPPTLLALIQFGPGSALAVAVGYLAVNVLLGNLVEPHLMGRRLGLSTLVVFLSLVFWGWVWGPLGMLLSVPLTMSTKILLENTESLRWVAVMLGDPPRKRLRRGRGLRAAKAGKRGGAASPAADSAR